ncbi:MAG: 8-oxo-dGTP diphosphatase MutT [Methylophaga sp.]|nr:8-oxo-dGTP diphosphatase MutT [Methylophaga sp.]
MAKAVHVAVAVIVNSEKDILLALRQAHQHQGGLWEFPGGKIEESESVYDALVREIDEEIGLTITSAHALIKISHDYGDKSVLLDVWWVDRFCGEPQSRERQQLRWCTVAALREDDFPAANVEIINAIKSELK